MGASISACSAYSTSSVCMAGTISGWYEPRSGGSDPAMRAAGLTASRAASAAAQALRLASAQRSAAPARIIRHRMAAYVAVVMMSAPARRKRSWSSRTRCGASSTARVDHNRSSGIAR